ncbi:hypothetical protein [Agromyces mariniharenae]|uniref:DUF3618 domain-containing protein n=1 Tax=Agromyces mariniharenae TaxID=2604423 RepID=A0A5S4UYQ7_9MICO|nr:hypothetical protein [Agromyces mariniharenae]TYL50261.1 hypothetical protein FYC51_13640 [Agromyces mariniharenae]
MTNSYPSNTPGGVPAADTTPEQSGDLRDDVSTLASDAGDAGRHVVDVAKDETRSVASETKHQARRFLGQVGDELSTQAATQQTRLAGGLRSAGSEFSEMANASTSSGYASELVRGAGERADSVARWLEQRDPRSVLEEVKGFARRRPGVFIAIAIGAGVLAGRVTRAIMSPPDEEGSAGRRAMTTGRADFTAPPVPPVREVQPPATTTVGTGYTGSTGTGTTGAATIGTGTIPGTGVGGAGGGTYGSPGTGGA